MNATKKIPFLVEGRCVILKGNNFFELFLDGEEIKGFVEEFYRRMKECERNHSYEDEPVIVCTGYDAQDDFAFHLEFNSKVDEQGRPLLSSYVTIGASWGISKDKVHVFPLMTWEEVKVWCEEILTLEF